MKKQTRNILVIGIIILIVGIFYISLRPKSPGQYDEFAQCLSEKGVVMYGTSWCSFCQRQKDLFGRSFGYIDFVDCDRNRQECLSAGVQGYPTWKINGENFPGFKSLQELSDLSGCERL
jgi:glutaredoxin